MAYQVLHPRWGIPPDRGTPQARSEGVATLARTGVSPQPGQGTPWPGLMGVPEVGYPPSQANVPPARSDGQGTSGQAKVPPRPGVAPLSDLAGVPPPGPGQGTPPWPDLRTDTGQNITFPRTMYVVGKKSANNLNQKLPK